MMESENSGPTKINNVNDELSEKRVLKKHDKINVKGTTRRKNLRDKMAPKLPPNGYIQFLNSRRVQFCADNPKVQFSEITKGLAAEWKQLPADRKQQYLSTAKQERVKYVQELAIHQRTGAYGSFSNQELKKKKNKKNNLVKLNELEKGEPPNENTNSEHDIPIYTEEFLSFNKARESELRKLRTIVIDQKQETSVLEKHIENMKNGILKVTADSQQLDLENMKYEEYLNNLRSKFSDALAGVSVPDAELPTFIDQKVDFFGKLLKTSNDTSLINNIKEAVSNIDLK